MVNALLGAEILPIHHNASTAVLCEIKHSTDGTKFAIAHFETKEAERLDLCSDEGLHLLKEYAQQGRGVPSQDQDEDICSKIEIFWPQSFLQVRQQNFSYTCVRHITLTSYYGYYIN